MNTETIDEVNTSRQKLEKALSTLLVLRKQRQAKAEGIRRCKQLAMREAQDQWVRNHKLSRIAKVNYTVELERQCEQNIGRPLPMQQLIAWQQRDQKARDHIDHLYSQVNVLEKVAAVSEENYTSAVKLAKQQMQATEKLNWIMGNLEILWP